MFDFVFSPPSFKSPPSIRLLRIQFSLRTWWIRWGWGRTCSPFELCLWGGVPGRLFISVTSSLQRLSRRRGRTSQNGNQKLHSKQFRNACFWHGLPAWRLCMMSASRSDLLCEQQGSISTRKTKKHWFYTRSLVCRSAAASWRAGSPASSSFFVFYDSSSSFGPCVWLSPMAAVCCNYHTHVQLNGSVNNSVCLAGLSRRGCVPGLGMCFLVALSPLLLILKVWGSLDTNSLTDHVHLERLYSKGWRWLPHHPHVWRGRYSEVKFSLTPAGQRWWIMVRHERLKPLFRPHFSFFFTKHRKTRAPVTVINQKTHLPSNVS